MSCFFVLLSWFLPGAAAVLAEAKNLEGKFFQPKPAPAADSLDFFSQPRLVELLNPAAAEANQMAMHFPRFFRFEMAVLLPQPLGSDEPCPDKRV